MSIFAGNLPWDGSNLGDIDKLILLERAGKPLNFLLLNLSGLARWVTYHRNKNLLPCIIDEIAPFFGIKKVGTHSAFYKGYRIIIYDTPGVYNDISQISPELLTKELKQKIQDVMVFRVFTGLYLNNHKNIIIKDHQLCPYNNRISLKLSDVSRISLTSMLEWFVDDIGDSKLRMGIDEDDIIHLRVKIEGVILRIDKELIFYENYIIQLINRIV